MVYPVGAGLGFGAVLPAPSPQLRPYNADVVVRPSLCNYARAHSSRAVVPFVPVATCVCCGLPSVQR